MIKNLFSTSLSSFSQNVALLILRLGIGALMLTHAYPKMMILSRGGEIYFPDPLGLGSITSLVLATLSELLGSVLIMLGLATRLASASLIFTMVVAVFWVHAGDAFAKKELGLLYLLVYVVLLITGSGRYSIDNRLARMM